MEVVVVVVGQTNGSSFILRKVKAYIRKTHIRHLIYTVFVINNHNHTE